MQPFGSSTIFSTPGIFHKQSSFGSLKRYTVSVYEQALAKVCHRKL